MATVHEIQDQAHAAGFDTLRGGVKAGLHTMPEGFVDALDRLDQLATLTAPRPGDHDALAPLDGLAAQAEEGQWYARRDRAAQMLFDRAGATLAYQDAAVIEAHLAPALTRLLDAFRADLAIIGPYQHLVAPNTQLLAEPSQELREAWIRFSEVNQRYATLRMSWAVLRRRDYATSDPQGADSILSEVANGPALIGPRWRDTRAFGAASPWVGPWPQPTHVRLAAILAAGGQLWMPSARQQSEAYRAVVPPRPGVPGHPLAALRGAGVPTAQPAG